MQWLQTYPTPVDRYLCCQGAGLTVDENKHEHTHPHHIKTALAVKLSIHLIETFSDVVTTAILVQHGSAHLALV